MNNEYKVGSSLKDTGMSENSFLVLKCLDAMIITLHSELGEAATNGGWGTIICDAHGWTDREIDLLFRIHCADTAIQIDSRFPFELSCDDILSAMLDLCARNIYLPCIKNSPVDIDGVHFENPFYSVLAFTSETRAKLIGPETSKHFAVFDKEKK
jgi:hypothetical protein